MSSILAAAVWLLACVSLADAADLFLRVPKSKSDGSARESYRSRHFFVHSDLPEDEVRTLCARMEEQFDAHAIAWGRTPRGVVECFIVHDIAKWTDAALPLDTGKLMVGTVGGATYLVRERVRGHDISRTRLMATTGAGVIDHELVHAYFCQAFGATGPDWFKEGMAEMARHSCSATRSVQCSRETAAILRDAPRRTAADIVTGVRFTDELGGSLGVKGGGALRFDGVASEEAIQEWNDVNGAAVDDAKAAYLWSWALCHTLRYNPNYSKRFRLLGESLLTRRGVDFGEVFAPMRHELEFEFGLFVRDVAPGYRVDLCRWDWGRRFRSLSGRERVTTRVQAVRGYQASGLSVARAQQYTPTVQGLWSVSRDVPAAAANDAAGRGCLMGVVFSDYALSEPFELHNDRPFSPPADGQLFLRCQDEWHELDDNSGEMTVHLELAGASSAD